MANEFKVKNGLATPIGPVINTSGEWVGAAIPNTKLVNNSIYVNGQRVELGQSLTIGPQEPGEPWRVVTSNYQAVTGERILATTAGATGQESFTVSLPASPLAGYFVTIADGGDWELAPLTVNRNGSTIEGINDNILLDARGAIVDFIYNGTTWQISSNIGQIGPTGPTGASVTGPTGPGVTGPTGAIGPTGAGANITVAANNGLAISNEELSTTYNTQVSDSVFSVAVGGAAALAASEWKTKNLVQVLDAILFPDVLPTYTIPTATITGNQSGNKEIGSTINQALTLTATENDAGVFTGLLLKRDNTTINSVSDPTGTAVTDIADQFGYADPNNPNLQYTLSYTDQNFVVVNGTTSWSGTGTYSAGLAKKNNKGVTDTRPAAVRSTSAPQSGSSINSSSVTVIGIYPYFWGKSSTPPTPGSIASAIAAGTTNKVLAVSTGTISVTFNATNEYVWMAHASAYTAKTKWYNTALNQGDIGAGNFILSPVAQSVNSPDNYWSAVSYSIYISDSPTDTNGAIEFRNS